MNIEDLLKLDTKTLREEHKLRSCHLHSLETNRLVATIATRDRNNGTVDVAVSIVHGTQGRVSQLPEARAERKALATLGRAKLSVEDRKAREEIRAKRALVEPMPSRYLGRRNSLTRLFEGNEGGETFTPAEALYIMETGPHTELRGAYRSPRDVRVVNFSKAALAACIKNRSVLRFFPGSQWVPSIRPPRNFDPATDTKFKKQKLASKLLPAAAVPVETFGTKVARWFGIRSN